ncbi:beta-lactamase/transpeptidase-like protein [Macrolepiota fuliginosa MF-IS2]|uniref:Beta-lactamase/transpeptidase-like protein n=1 Tax=Macrolepiota fuliginosa MF-IS2 TaxID=1400762 RepID=A0A9P5XE96_9AGAR|nr:beta-lactamase/transpeptidase-like protein [Macrolepiota fuliginosa MF-IS2]
MFKLGPHLQFIVTCTLLLHSRTILGLNQTKLITPDIDEYIKTVIQQWDLTGLSVAIARHDPDSPTGWHQEFQSYGIAKADGTSVTEDTLFSVASNSKLFTAMATGLLISNETLKKERGLELSWLTKVRDVFGDAWGLMDEEASRGTTIQDMLSHRTGLPRHDGSDVPRKGGLADKVKMLRYLRPSAEFWETYQYNNLMYDSLGYLPEVLVNQELGSYVEQHIFTPLNMSSSTYSVAKAEGGSLADGFTPSEQGPKRDIDGVKKAIIPYYVRPEDENLSAGSGGVKSSARDMAMWLSMLLALGRHPHRNKQIIPLEIVEHAATGASVSAGVGSFPEISVSVYGAGQSIFSYRGYEVVEHSGDDTGFASDVTRLPNDNLGIALLNNDLNGHPALYTIKWRFVDELVGIEDMTRKESKTPVPRPDHPSPPTVSFSDLQKRTYRHPTYGMLKSCVISSSPLDSTETEQTVTAVADDCPAIISSLPVQRILDISDLSIPTLIIPFKGRFTTHIRLTHFTGDVFNATAIWTNAEVRLEEGLGSVENGHWTDDGDVVIPLLDFEVEWSARGGVEGLAFKGNVWGRGVGAREPVGDGEEGAEVWFTRVNT